MLFNSLLISLYIFFALFLFNSFESFKVIQIPFFSTLAVLLFFLPKKEKYFKILSLFISFLFVFFSFYLLSTYFFLSVFLILFLWFNFYLNKNPKLLFLIHLFLGFFLLFSISSLKEPNLMNFLISLHFSLPFSLSFIRDTLYFEKEPDFPYGHFIPALFGFTGIIFVILRVYSFLIFIPLFVLLSISIYSTLYQPPYKKPYPLIYQICIFSCMLFNYLGLNL